MPNIRINGADKISYSINKLMRLPPEAKERVLTAGAAVVADKLKAVLKRLGHVRSTPPQLVNSITVRIDRSRGDLIAVVSASGKRKKGYTGKRKGKWENKGYYEATNREVLHLLEYGTERMDATHPVEIAVEESTDAFMAAVEEAVAKELADLGL